MELEEAFENVNRIRMNFFDKQYKKSYTDDELADMCESLSIILQYIKYDSIPKKKIEDKKKEQEEKYNNSVNDVYKKPTEALIDFQRIVGAKEVLQELLEDK